MFVEWLRTFLTLSLDLRASLTIPRISRLDDLNVKGLFGIGKKLFGFAFKAYSSARAVSSKGRATLDLAVSVLAILVVRTMRGGCVCVFVCFLALMCVCVRACGSVSVCQTVHVSVSMRCVREREIARQADRI